MKFPPINLLSLPVQMIEYKLKGVRHNPTTRKKVEVSFNSGIFKFFSCVPSPSHIEKQNKD